MSNRRAILRQWREQLADDDAQTAREAHARTVAESMQLVGQALHVGGYVLRDENANGLSLATRMGGALALGSCDLLDAGNAYGAAALVRQLVEVEYLLWTFAGDADDAARWLGASRTQLGKHFTPAAMRERSGGQFRTNEYRSHCEHGGHPNPAGWFLLTDSPPLDPVRSAWVDLGQHLERGWRVLRAACEAAAWSEVLPEHRWQFVEHFRLAWHERDPLAARLDALPD